MGSFEYRLECIRLASENLRALMATGRETISSAKLADQVTSDAERLLAFVYEKAA